MIELPNKLIPFTQFPSLNQSFNYGCLFPRGKEEKKNGQTNQMKLIKLIEFVVGAAERPPAYNPPLKREKGSRSEFMKEEGYER